MKTQNNLKNAKKNKNDEFYTKYEDIEKELQHYKDQILGKIIYCNCDEPYKSNFAKYFFKNFFSLGLKKLFVTCYRKENNGLKMVCDEKSVSVTPLDGDGDFRSDECVEILKQSDIVITNPPFSLFRDYIQQLVDYDKKYLILGNHNELTCKGIFPLVMEGKIRYGYTSNGLSFISKDSEKFFGSIRWMTNLKVNKQNFLKLTCHYNPKEYPHYDNYTAINVNKTENIPMDYEGIMGVPISFLDKYNPEQFEIVGLSGLNSYRTKTYPRQIQYKLDGRTESVTKLNDSATLMIYEPINGKTYYKVGEEMFIAVYKRIFIRKRQNCDIIGE